MGNRSDRFEMHTKDRLCRNLGIECGEIWGVAGPPAGLRAAAVHCPQGSDWALQLPFPALSTIVAPAA